MGEFIISALKFVLAVLLAPAIMAAVVAFRKHLPSPDYPSTYEEFFLWGFGAYLVIYLFFHQFWGFYEFGQKIMGGILKVLAPLDRIITNLLPFYLILILLAFYITTSFFKVTVADPYFIFFVGFAFAMHIILVAQDMQNQEKSPIKPNYLLQICIILVFSICMVVLFLDLISGKFTFPTFIQSFYDLAGTYYFNILRLLASPGS